MEISSVVFDLAIDAGGNFDTTIALPFDPAYIQFHSARIYIHAPSTSAYADAGYATELAALEANLAMFPYFVLDLDADFTSISSTSTKRTICLWTTPRALGWELSSYTAPQMFSIAELPNRSAIVYDSFRIKSDSHRSLQLKGNVRLPIPGGSLVHAHEDWYDDGAPKPAVTLTKCMPSRVLLLASISK